MVYWKGKGNAWDHEEKAMISFLVILILLLSNPPKVLVLTNGKVLTCRSYEVANGMVTLYMKDQSFSIPEKMVDWERSKKETIRRKAEQEQKALEKARAEARAAELEEEAEAKPKKPISFTQSDYKKIAKRTGRATTTGTTTVKYRKMGNTILVSAGINGKGPFDFVLDTGAAVTVISPDTAGSLSITPTQEQARLVGVAGEAINAHYGILREVALGNSKVFNLKAVIRGIPQLNDLQIVGLLGQDFLNHFVMSLDSAGQTLTLTPHGLGSVVSSEAIQDPRVVFEEFRSVAQALDGHYKRVVSLGGQRAGMAELGLVKEINGKISKLRTQIGKYRNTLEDFPVENLSPKQRENVEGFLNCYAHFNRILSELQRFAQQLGKAYSNPGAATVLSVLDRRRDGVNEAVRKFQDCQ